MIATGLFAENSRGVNLAPEDGCFKGGHGNLLGWNVAGSIVITLWNGVLVAIVVSQFSFTVQNCIFI